MIEELFTLDEIREVLLESNDSKYDDPHLMHIGSRKTSIHQVSKRSGLILAYGNDHTGWKHIVERHSLTSRKPYWKDNGQIDNPTKFPLGTSSRDCILLADQIFKPDNKNETLNKRQDYFDLYLGKCQNRKGILNDYMLLTYKGTGLIHSFFIKDNDKPYNKEKILNLRQGWSNGSHNLKSCVQDVKIPYYDPTNIIRFVVLIRFFEAQGIEKWYIQVNSEKGEPFVTTFIKENKLDKRMDIAFRTVRTDFSNITWVEKIIKRIQDGVYSY